MKSRDMSISDRTIAALESMGYVEPTEVQEKTIPLLLEGKEVVVRSQTGSGKTAAFGVGLIETLSKNPAKKALILAPTRELVDQILDQLNPKRQTMLFSATIDDRIKSLSGHYMGLPVLVEIGPKGKVESIEEQTIYLARREKPQKLAEILRNVSVSRAIIFVSTKRAVEFV